MNQKNKVKFSVVTVVKNDQNKISKTIKSILNQSFKNYQYIIIDGNSSDQTKKKILKYKKKLHICISENDKGIYYAMNKALKYVKGEIIVFVNSGDTLTRDALKEVKKVFNSNINYDFVFGTVKRHYTKKTIIKHGFNRNRLRYNFDFATSHSTGFYVKSKILKKYGKFNTKFKISADYDLYYRLILKNNLTGGSTPKNKIIGIMSKGGFSSKISFFEHLKEEMKIRIHNKQNLFLIILIFFNAIIKNFFKRN